MCGKLHVVGSTDEFPARYTFTARGLSKAVRSARPADVKDIKLKASFQDPDRKLLKFNVSGRLDLVDLRQEVSKLERHFQDKMFLSRPLFEKAARCTEKAKVNGTCPEPITNFKDCYNWGSIDSAAIGKLYWTIKVAFHQYAKEYHVNMDRLYFINIWINCLREGQDIREHHHGPVVAGNVAIQVPPGSYTYYKLADPTGNADDGERGACESGVHEACHLLMFKERLSPSYSEDYFRNQAPLKISNFDGDMVLFLGELAHGSGAVQQKMQRYLNDQPADCRMTAAFDILPNPTTLNSYEGLHVIPLYDPKDPWWENDPYASIGDNLGAAMEKVFKHLKVPAAFEWDVMPDADTFWNRYGSIIEDQKLKDKLAKWGVKQGAKGWEKFRRSRKEKRVAEEL